MPVSPSDSLPNSYAASLAKAKVNAPENKKFLSDLKRKPPAKLDEHIHRLHEQVFAKTDCLQCANCCKTTSPIFYQKDIERIARHLRIKPSQFIEAYLRVDEEQDFVLKTAPCPFLSSDHYCSIYDARPTACREYPHTNRKKMHQLLDLTFQNTLVCPAVSEIISLLKSISK